MINMPETAHNCPVFSLFIALGIILEIVLYGQFNPCRVNLDTNY